MYDRLKPKDKRDHFWHELGIVRQGTPTQAYKDGWDRIFGNKSAREDTADEKGNTK